ncbi:MAG: glutaredoxin family protein [Betaproteobacteria bacterium]
MNRLLFLVLLLACASASAQMYRWVDQNGKVHYTDTPPPPSAAKSVEQKKLGGSVIETSQLPFQLQEAVRNYPVTLYTSPSCKDGCPQARELLAKRGVPFKEVSVADEQSNALLKKVSGANQVPTLSVGSLVQIGFESGALNSLLDTGGYPKTAINLPGVTKAQAPAPAAPAPAPAVTPTTTPPAGNAKAPQ